MGLSAKTRSQKMKKNKGKEKFSVKEFNLLVVLNVNNLT